MSGGCNGNACTSAEIYDPSQDQWSAATSMNVARVDATATAGAEPLRRSRPDRARALKQLHEDSAYLERIREAVAEARADPRPPLSSTEAHLHMEALKTRLGDQLQTALKRHSSRE